MGASSMYRRPLSRDSAHRQALLKNLVTALINKEQISTTYAKAKETQRMAEKLITLGKKNTEAARNSAKGFFHEPELYINKVFGKLRERYKDRPGGYTRILKTGGRPGDNADMCFIELVDFNENMLSAKAPAKAKTSRRGGKKKSTTAAAKTTDKKEDSTKSTDEASKSE